MAGHFWKAALYTCAIASVCIIYDDNIWYKQQSIARHRAKLSFSFPVVSWWRHQMETFSALLSICAGNSPVTDEFPAQRLVTRSFDVFFDLRLNKRLSKQSCGWWFETPSRPLWRHCNVVLGYFITVLGGFCTITRATMRLNQCQCGITE